MGYTLGALPESSLLHCNGLKLMEKQMTEVSGVWERRNRFNFPFILIFKDGYLEFIHFIYTLSKKVYRTLENLVYILVYYLLNICLSNAQYVRGAGELY